MVFLVASSWIQFGRETAWIPVQSSNVQAIRWMPDHPYPLQVRFRSTKLHPASIYGYQTPFEIYDDFFAAPSMGRFVWNVLRGSGYPYRKLS